MQKKENLEIWMLKMYVSTQKNPRLFREFNCDVSDIWVKVEDIGNYHALIFTGIKHINEAIL